MSYSSGWWNVRQIPTRWSSRHHLSGHTSVGRVGRYMDLAGYVLDRCQSVNTVWHKFRLADIHVGRFETGILEPQGAVPQVLTLLGRFIAGCLKRPFLLECWWGPRHFCARQACLGNGPALRPHLKKALCHTRPVGGTYDKYRFDEIVPFRIPSMGQIYLFRNHLF